MDLSSKKSRIAVVLSGLWVILSIVFVEVVHWGGWDAGSFLALLIITLPVTGYWSWQWIKAGK